MRKFISWILAFLGIQIVGIGYLAGRLLTGRRKPDPADSPANYGMPFKAVYFHSRDGFRLHGWWIPAQYARGTIIQCHGHNGSMDSDIGSAQMLHQAGFNVLMFNFRAHGKSAGDSVTFGWFEANDLIGAVDYLAQSYGIKKVGVLGFSMGASVAIRAASYCDQIACIVADGVIGRLDVSLEYWLQDKGLPVWLAAPVSKLALSAASVRTGASLNQVNTIQWVADLWDCPLFVVHGVEDHLVPIAEIEDLVANARVETKVWFAEACDHREAMVLYPDEYAEQVVAWFLEHLV